MSIRLDKPLQQLSQDNIKKLAGNLGVFQLADDNGNIIYIGYAGGKSLFGLRGEVDACKDMQGASLSCRGKHVLPNTLSRATDGLHSRL